MLRRVMTLAAAAEELAAWQDEAADGAADGAAAGAWRTVEPRALIVTHMMNRLLSRGY